MIVILCRSFQSTQNFRQQISCSFGRNRDCLSADKWFTEELLTKREKKQEGEAITKVENTGESGGFEPMNHASSAAGGGKKDNW